MNKISENKNESISWQFLISDKNEDFANKSNMTKIFPSHRGDIKILDNDKSSVIKTDGLLTNDPRITIFLKTADCIPAILYWPGTDWFGLIHMGYDGLLLDLTKKLIRKINKLNLSADKTKIIFGPSICEKCYDHNGIIRKLKWSVLHSLYPEFAKKEAKEYTFDLKSAYVDQFTKLGIKKNQIDEPEKLCTNCDLHISRHHKTFNDTLVTVVEKKLKKIYKVRNGRGGRTRTDDPRVPNAVL
jgi:copper oxidase (laccase) domain-containing protein